MTGGGTAIIASPASRNCCWRLGFVATDCATTTYSIVSVLVFARNDAQPSGPGSTELYAPTASAPTGAELVVEQGRTPGSLLSTQADVRHTSHAMCCR